MPLPAVPETSTGGAEASSSSCSRVRCKKTLERRGVGIGEQPTPFLVVEHQPSLRTVVLGHALFHALLREVRGGQAVEGQLGTVLVLQLLEGEEGRVGRLDPPRLRGDRVVVHQAPEVDRHRVTVPAEGEQQIDRPCSSWPRKSPEGAPQLLDPDPRVPYAVFEKLELLPELLSAATREAARGVSSVHR